jgi:hypothetical protein
MIPSLVSARGSTPFAGQGRLRSRYQIILRDQSWIRCPASVGNVRHDPPPGGMHRFHQPAKPSNQAVLMGAQLSCEFAAVELYE